MPITTYATYAKRPLSNRRSPYVELPLDNSDIEIKYSSPTSSLTQRCIHPVGLKFLKNGQVALIARCRLRDDIRTFAFERILAASLPMHSSPHLSGPEIAAFFASDIRRLIVQETVLNDTLLISGAGREKHRKVNRAAPFRKKTGVADATAPESSLKTAIAKFLGEAIKHADLLCAQSENDTSPITMTAQARGKSLDAHVDGPSHLLTLLHDGSSHERLAHLARRSGLRHSACDLLSLLQSWPSVSRHDLSVHASLFGHAGRWQTLLWLRDLPINGISGDVSGVASEFARKLSEATHIAEEDSPLWAVTTQIGDVTIKARDAQDAATGFAILSAGTDLTAGRIAATPHSDMALDNLRRHAA